MAHLRWSAAEDDTLRRLYLAASVRDIAAVLGLKPAAVYKRIRGLNLAESSPLETVGSAARRRGFTYAEFDGVLARAGVVCQTPGKRHWRVVLRAEADRATREWLETENVTQAARARDVDPEDLREWLTEIGEFKRFKVRAEGMRQRVKTSVIDRVVAERRKGKAA